MDIFDEEQLGEEIFSNSSEEEEIIIESDSGSDYEVEIESDSEIASIDGVQYYYNDLDSENLNDICDEEDDFIDEPRVNNQYCIGLCGRPLFQSKILLLSCVSAKTFLKYKLDDILLYLVQMSLTLWRGRPKINILKISINERGEYVAITKTFWLKIIQRKWKKIYKERCDTLKKMKSLVYLRNREINGISTYYPSLNGLYYYGNLNTLVK
jgi:hypothetical protein